MKKVVIAGILAAACLTLGSCTGDNGTTAAPTGNTHTAAPTHKATMFPSGMTTYSAPNNTDIPDLPELLPSGLLPTETSGQTDGTTSGVTGGNNSPETSETAK